MSQTGPRSEFMPASMEDEVGMVRRDDQAYTATKRYLRPLIDAFFEKASFTLQEEVVLRDRIDSDLPKALQLYQEQEHPKKGFKFSAYFMWWMYQRAKEVDPELADKFN